MIKKTKSKVLVPQFIAEFVDEYNIDEAFDILHNNHPYESNYFYTVSRYLRKNKDDDESSYGFLARIYVNGYIVEEPLYYIQLIDGFDNRYELVFINRHRNTGALVIDDRFDKNSFQVKFTKDEVEQMNSKYLDFLVPVEDYGDVKNHTHSLKQR